MRTRGGLSSKLHAVCDGHERPLVMLLSEGQMSDYKGAALMLPATPSSCRLAPRRPRQAAHRSLHSFEIQPESRDPL